MFLTICLHLEIHVIQVNDVHGWIYGHKDNTNLGDLATVLSYYQRVEQNISKSASNDAAVILVDGGDACEGTGLSDLVEPRCSEIYNFMAELPFDAVTLGNHDLSSEQAISYLHANQKMYKKNAVLTTNTKWEDGSSFGEYCKLAQLSNGAKVLMFGFMYSSSNKYPHATVTPQTIELKSRRFREVLDKHLAETDLILLDFHQGYNEAELTSTVNEFRKMVGNTPIHVIASHDHKVYKGACYHDLQDALCITTDAGRYLEHIVHTVWTLGAQTTAEIFPYTNFTVGKTTSGEGLAARFGLTPEEFDTPSALMLRKKIQARVSELGLSDTFAYSSYIVKSGKNVDVKDSMLRLWTYAIGPALIFNPELEKDCVQFLVTRSAFARVDLPIGNVTLDEACISVPYQYEMQYLKNVTPAQAKCIYDWINLGLWAGEPLKASLPYYVVPNATFEGRCYDMVANEYEIPRMMLAYETCQMTGPKPLSYPTSSGITRSDKIFREYLRLYWQNASLSICQSESAQKSTYSIIEGLSIPLLAVLVAAFGLLLCTKQRDEASFV